jgi:hypothetical protein
VRPPFDDPEVLRKLRPAFEAGPIRSLLLPRACFSVVRGRGKKLFFSFFLAHRGRYEVAELAHLGEVKMLAESVAGRPLKPAGRPRLFRFSARGYSLVHDDALTRVERGIEVTLDLSRQTGGPPAVYQRGPAQKLVVPQAPGLVAVVERTPETYRYDRYLPASMGPARVLRLRAAFRYAD